MEQQRVQSMFGCLILLVLFLYFALDEFIVVGIQASGIVGVVVGMVVGVMINNYINQKWDPVRLVPANPQVTSHASIPSWALPLTVVLVGVTAPISSFLFEVEVVKIITWSFCGIGIVVIGNFMVRLWWYRPK